MRSSPKKWDSQFPKISRSWRSNWERLTPFFAYPAEIRKVIYTTNAIESVNRSLRKIIKNRGSFPTDEAAIKLRWLINSFYAHDERDLDAAAHAKV